MLSILHLLLSLFLLFIISAYWLLIRTTAIRPNWEQLSASFSRFGRWSSCSYCFKSSVWSSASSRSPKFFSVFTPPFQLQCGSYKCYSFRRRHQRLREVPATTRLRCSTTTCWCRWSYFTWSLHSDWPRGAHTFARLLTSKKRWQKPLLMSTWRRTNRLRSTSWSLPGRLSRWWLKRPPEMTWRRSKGCLCRPSTLRSPSLQSRCNVSQPSRVSRTTTPQITIRSRAATTQTANLSPCQAPNQATSLRLVTTTSHS